MAKAIFGKVLNTLIVSAAVVGTTAQMAFAQGFSGDFAPEQWELFNSSPAFEGIDNSDITIGDINTLLIFAVFAGYVVSI